MGTGIVSVALWLDGEKVASRILLALTAVVWIALGLVLLARASLDRSNLVRDAHEPAALTSVAGTAVLGSGFTLLGWSPVAEATLGIAFGLWLVLLAPVLRGWVTPTVGVSLMLTVSTEALAVEAAALAARERAGWLLYAALAPFLLGLAFYAFVISDFDLHQLLAGRGDHWITGGALAISTLAAAQITSSAASLHRLVGLGQAPKTVSLVLWAVAIAWLPVLLAAEAVRRRLVYDLRRWGTVFPVGMYAACSFAVGAAAGAPAITDFARVWVWVALVVWVAAFAGMLRHGRQIAHDRP